MDNNSMMHQPPSGPGQQDDLPAPWIREFSNEYQTYYYVNPTTTPPTTSWTHPSFSDGEAAPEQVHAIQAAVAPSGAAGGGSASDFMNSAPAQDSNQVQYPTSGTPNQGPQAGEGERGMGTNMAMNMLQQQMGGGKHNGGGYGGGGGYGHSSGGGAAGMVGKLASSFLGGNKQNHNSGGYNSGGYNSGGYNNNNHNSYGSPSGAPPFMSGGGGGGLGGILSNVMGGNKHNQGGHGGQSGGGLGGILSSVMGGGNQHHGQQGGYQGQQGGYGGQQGGYGGGQGSYGQQGGGNYGGQGGYGQQGGSNSGFYR